MLISSQRIYTGRVVSLDRDKVRFPNGNIGELEMLRHPGASAVLPLTGSRHDPDPEVLLIRQYRHATGGWLWEIPAGRREAEEPPELTARRELAEETGYHCEQLTRLTSIWTTPGFTDEVIHLFLAEGLSPGESAREADEVMELHILPWSKVMEMIESSEIRDTKTLNALLFAAQFAGIGRHR